MDAYLATDAALKVNKMKKGEVKVVFDRKCKVKKDEDGIGKVDVMVYLSRSERKYINVGSCKRSEFEKYSRKRNVHSIVSRCENVLSAMPVLKLQMTVENFNTYYEDQTKPISVDNTDDFFKGVDQRQDFIEYFEKCVEEENISKGTRKNKRCTIAALKRFGKIKTFADLTPAKITAFDTWLRDGTRTQVSIYSYHKNLRKVVRRMYQAEMIPRNPYGRISVQHGTCKTRKPLSEAELKMLRDFKLEGKLDRVRDLFIFSAYTGLSFCDVMVFDFKLMAVKEGKMWYIDGSRVKTGGAFYTPILPPAMAVLEKYNYNLPHISNQKCNDYLHLVQAHVGIKKNLTFHIARHSFATMVLSHDIPIENLARMLGHRDVKITQLYAKILHTTIERHCEKLEASLL